MTTRSPIEVIIPASYASAYIGGDKFRDPIKSCPWGKWYLFGSETIVKKKKIGSRKHNEEEAFNLIILQD